MVEIAVNPELEEDTLLGLDLGARKCFELGARVMDELECSTCEYDRGTLGNDSRNTNAQDSRE